MLNTEIVMANEQKLGGLCEVRMRMRTADNKTK